MNVSNSIIWNQNYSVAEIDEVNNGLLKFFFQLHYPILHYSNLIKNILTVTVTFTLYLTSS